ncbi:MULTISPECIES: cation:proton antiporter domain-containing protein [Planktothricoides]|uniref:Cation:proton antiporter n=2 Tax=Planktothricoides raciborskii TaxID=132608 RepID=A0AAU8JGM1_9CYAN|nr:MULTISPECIES: cation:proton antiporter [Planktothricoides]KOR34255.1 sodium:calcium exchanger [Planktothricoides sp. SR001]MBD2547671.1 cation:proton antiporter [Planktothricoides raciborskii FACHB-1370]MBD2586113.1 cation:proton antiporter [Planktothricoides raciborskii FACHB-1261]
MPENFRLIIDLVTVLAVAAAGGLLASALRQPPLLGYLLGGMIVGPASLGWIKEFIQVETLAQFGVALLLFALGVEFSFAELRKVKAIALGGGSLQIGLTIAVTTLISLSLGWVLEPAQGVFLGAILSLSSTAVVLKCLIERNETETPHGQVMLGILVVQDLALGFMLAVLPALDEPAEAIGMALLNALLRIALFAGGAVLAGIFVVPRLLRLLAKTESRELFLLGVVVLCLGIALLTEHLGFSIEMGAFVAGLMISEVEYADQTLTYVEPLRDIFAALFFVSVGMLIDPIFLWNHLELILGLVALVLVGKFLITTPLVMIFGYSLRTALLVGLGLAQIGEFSFVLTARALGLGLVSRPVYLFILGTTAVTLMVTPLLLKLMPKLLDWAETVPWFMPYFDQTGTILGRSEDLPGENHVVVCGYGRVGRKVVQLLQAHNYPVVVIDLSEAAIQELRSDSTPHRESDSASAPLRDRIPYIYGNAASLHVLESAGVRHAKAMAIALPDSMSTRLCLKRSLELSPDLDIVVQANQEEDIELLYQLGAREVVQSEFEVSLELSTHLLLTVGFSLSGIQREIGKIRSHHYEGLRSSLTASEVSRQLKAATQDMNPKWLDLPEASPLVGMTLTEVDLRRLTGVSLMAIRRSSREEIDYPNGETLLLEGDRLLLIGTPAEISTFSQLASGEIAVESESRCCQWLRVPLGSPMAGETLANLDLRRKYQIQVFAIRREGHFIQFPHGDMTIQAGDLLFLRGRLADLKQIQLSLLSRY